MDQDFNAEQLEMMKWIIGLALILPGLFLVRFVIYLIIPRGVLKIFHKKHGYKNKGVLKKEKKFYDED